MTNQYSKRKLARKSLSKMEFCMSNWKVFTHSLLLVTTPLHLSYAQDHLPQITQQDRKIEVKEKIKAGDFYSLTYDDMLDFYKDIDSGEFENYCSEEDMEWIAHFLIFFAREGVLPGDTEYNQILEEDIQELLHELNISDDDPLSFNGDYKYQIFPIGSNDYEIVLCKNIFSKAAKAVKNFVKKHKEAVIITTAIVIAVVTAGVVIATCAAPAAAAVAAALDSDKDDKQKEKESVPLPPSMMPMYEAMVKPAIQDEVSWLKGNMANQQMLYALKGSEKDDLFTVGENGRVLGSLFAHEMFRNINPLFSDNIQDPWHSPVQQHNDPSLLLGHYEVDQKFATAYTPMYMTPEFSNDFNSLFYQARGEKALSFGKFEQATQDFDKAIELNPISPIPYLDRGIAHFGLGQFDKSLEDYRQFASQMQNMHPFSTTEFSFGVVKGLPRGIYDSGESIYLFLSDLVTHPFNTCGQMWDAFSLLVKITSNGEWNALSEVLAPEVHYLLKEWDNIASDKRGELAGYAFGKYGADIIIPGALTKAIAKGVKGAQELSVIRQSFQTAEKTLVLESVAGLETGARVGEVIRSGQTAAFLGDELGFTTSEMAQLKQAGKLEAAIDNACESWIAKSPSEAYKTAMNGGRHADLIPQYSVRSAKEIEKGIKSFERQIIIHQDKIANPIKYCPDWDTFHPNRQKALVEKIWPAEIKCYTEQRDILQAILNKKQ